jgi:hypothetical protein
VPIPENQPRTYTTIFAAMCVSFCLGLFHSIMAFRQRGKFSRMMEDIRELQVGPLGEQSKELELPDLARLPSQQPPGQMLLSEEPSPPSAEGR